MIFTRFSGQNDILGDVEMNFLLAMMTLHRVDGFGERKLFELAPSVMKMIEENQISTESLCDLANRGTLIPKCDVAEVQSWYEESKSNSHLWSEGGIQVTTAFSPDYPPLLKETSKHPFFLYYKGDISPLSKNNIAIVGTRKPTAMGERQAKSIGKRIIQAGFGVVSGLALGCDTAGHEGALEGGGYTCAILAHGLDIITPRKNIELAQRILENGGALVSEHNPGVPPARRNYAMRNRIQSALSSHVIVIETALNGGTMLTAKYAVEQNRLLGVLSFAESDSSSEYAEGVNEISNNLSGKILYSTDDVLSYVQQKPPEEE